MHILAALGQYWLDIIIVILLLVIILVPIIKAIRNNNKDKLLEYAKSAVKIAERMYKSKTGQIKKNEAIDWVLQRSIIARIFFSKKRN